MKLTKNDWIKLLGERNALLKACELALPHLQHNCEAGCWRPSDGPPPESDCPRCMVVVAIEKARLTDIPVELRFPIDTVPPRSRKVESEKC